MRNFIKFIAKTWPNKITLLLYLFICNPSGLKPAKKDDRDLQTKNLGWSLFGYTAKHARKVNQTLSVKNQGGLNTCVFNGSTTMHEPNESIELEPQYILIKAKQENLIQGTGFTDIRTAFKMMQKYGIPRKGLLPGQNDNFNIYSNAIITPEIEADAAKHKIHSFWAASSRDDILKLLDEGKILGTGLPWYNGFNQGGGFSFPWLITKFVGWLVGGHFVTIKGYDINYQTRKVYICQNTYGALWGDGGDYYVDMDFMEKNDYGIYTILDVPLDLGKFLTEYDGKNVKCKEEATIYSIQQGKKKPYLHEMDYFVYNIGDSKMLNFSVVDKEILDQLPTGDYMDITKSLYWDALKHLDEPRNLTRSLEALSEWRKTHS